MTWCSWSALSEAGEATNLNLVHLKGFDACDVRDLTAAEMGWISQRQAEWFYVPEEQADALARLPDLP